MYLWVLLILKHSEQAVGQMAKDVTVKSSISTSLVLLFHCPQPFPLSLLWKKKTYFLFFMGTPILQSTPSVPQQEHTRIDTSHFLSGQSWVQSGHRPQLNQVWLGAQVNQFLTWWHTLCAFEMCMHVCWLIRAFSGWFIVFARGKDQLNQKKMEENIYSCSLNYHI